MTNRVHEPNQFLDDDDNDDDFFIGNIAHDNEYSPAENVYVESEPVKNPTSIPEESSDSGTDSDTDIVRTGKHNVENETVELDSEDDIMIIDPPETSKTKRRSSGRQTRNSSIALTSPPKRKRPKRIPSIAASLFETDENDEFFKEIAREASRIPSGTRETTPDQPHRIYNVRFVSKLDGSLDKAVQVKVLGKYDFASILPSVLSGFVREYKIPNVIKKIYAAENVTLYWNTAKILNFMTCNSLKIPQAFDNEISDIDITMVPKDYEKTFEQNINSRFLGEDLLSEARSDTLGPGNVDSRVEAFEKELKSVNDAAVNESVEYIDLDNEDDTSLIKIALMGQDNKKIFVNVRSSTTLRKVAEYYKKKKNLLKGAKLELIFDHEKLNLNGNIGEQDMEDEDMIEVVIK